MASEILAIMKTESARICSIHCHAKSISPSIGDETSALALTSPRKAVDGDAIPDGAYCFQYWSVTWLQGICSDLEPVAGCSNPLRKLVVHGIRDQGKLRLLELIDSVTDKSPRTPIQDKSYKVLLAECEELNKSRGRRASDMVLPPNWDTCGQYAA